MSLAPEIIRNAACLVVKVGSSLLIGEGSAVQGEWLRSLAADIAETKARGTKVVIVTSGAIAIGRTLMGTGSRWLDLTGKQAAAACGQISLMVHWSEALTICRPRPLVPAQILLTIEDSENRDRHLNVRHTFTKLLSHPHIIPIVNENDTVATEEIRFGDNDRLAAQVAQMVSADLLILLSGIDGLYAADPAHTPDAEFIREVDRITHQIESMADVVTSDIGTGGMRTKIEAAKTAIAAGCHMIVADGREPNPIRRIIDGERCTLFRAHDNPVTARKKKIWRTLNSNGSVVVDDEAVSALRAGKSLLPGGVGEVSGAFERGDAVDIKDAKHSVIGKGLTGYSAEDVTRILGVRGPDVEGILGTAFRDTLIHSDDLVLFDLHLKDAD
jgi:glutamate 5-kinase